MNALFTALAPLMLGLSPAESLDRVALHDGGSISGKVRSIDAEGVVVDSPIAAAPFQVQRDALQSITFARSKGGYRPHSELLHLVNGDALPGEVHRIDQDGVNLHTWYAGDIVIPRNLVRSIDYGVTPQRLVFQGPKGLADWVDNDDWELENGRLVCDASGTISRPGILPDHFILRFRVEWENSPNFRLYFCDDHLKRTPAAERYYFELNSAGLQLKRETVKGDRRWYNLDSSPRQPEEFAERGIDVEIRVDRKSRLLHLYLDGEKVGPIPDPIGDFPAGKGIMLESRASGGNKNIIPMIEVYEWDAISQFRWSEGHGDPNSDAIVDSNGERYSGSILGLDEEAEPRVALESPFAEDPLMIRTRDISTIYFKQSGAEAPPRGKIRFDLRGGGELHLVSLVLGEEVLEARHPLLGGLKLSRASLEHLEMHGDDQSSTDSDQ